MSRAPVPHGRQSESQPLVVHGMRGFMLTLLCCPECSAHAERACGLCRRPWWPHQARRTLARKRSVEHRRLTACKLQLRTVTACTHTTSLAVSNSGLSTLEGYGTGAKAPSRQHAGTRSAAAGQRGAQPARDGRRRRRAHLARSVGCGAEPGGSVQAALLAVLGVLDDAGWAEALPALAALMGGGADRPPAARLAAVRALPTASPRGALLQQRAAAALAGDLLQVGNDQGRLGTAGPGRWPRG